MSRWTVLREKIAHAFAVTNPEDALTPEEEALLGRVADGIVRRRMGTPALLALEAMAPIQFVGGQALIALRPFFELAVPAAELETVMRLCEKRGALGRLCDLVERSEA